MTAITHQKSDLRQQAVTRMLNEFDAGDDEKKRKLFKEVLFAVSGKYNVTQLREWVENLDRVYGRQGLSNDS